MKVGDLVKVKWANPTSKEKIGVLIEFKRYRKSKSEFAKVFHTNGHTRHLSYQCSGGLYASRRHSKTQR